MQARFLLGPAGSGKTFRCLAEIRAALAAAPGGNPLVLIAPKQATFQLERQLLADGALRGYARLQILSFERLAQSVLETLGVVPPPALSEEGRVMVLRALLMRHAEALKLFPQSARRPGFAQELGRLLNELQQHQLTPARLLELSRRGDLPRNLRAKLHDLALLAGAYATWLASHGLQDANSLLDFATRALRDPSNKKNSKLHFEGLWLDGFAEMTPQELDLLAAVLPHCDRATLAFCLDESGLAAKENSWLSIWSAVGKTFQQCRAQISNLSGCKVETEVLERVPGRNRFADNSALAELEAGWLLPNQAPERRRPARPKTDLAGSETGAPTAILQISNLKSQISITACANPQAEADFAAWEILKFVRAGPGGNRFRDCAVIVRTLDAYHQPLERAFRRHEIPFFLDRRESVAHHPLAELTRSSLRTVAFDWQNDDWFAALKSGFAPVAELEIDGLENAALEFGWRGKKWREPLPDEAAERLRQIIFPPYEALWAGLSQVKFQPTGGELAATLRALWSDLRVETTMERWALEDERPATAHRKPAIHSTVWEQMNLWLDNVALAFSHEALPLRDWLPILEAGLVNLTVGVIPPALDEVLVGAIDRARNPAIRFALVLGLNETVFPVVPALSPILTDADRDELGRTVSLGPDLRAQLARERFYGYIACTRASERLVLTSSRQDAAGKALNPSPFITHLQAILPSLEVEEYSGEPDWRDAQHVCELVGPLTAIQNSIFNIQNWDSLLELPALKSLAELLGALREPPPAESLSPDLAEKIYGPVLRSSVSRLEEFASCPFRFFVRSGLRADERKIFKLDARERGSFQHEVLKQFHESLAAEEKRWRDLTPAAARERIATIAADLAQSSDYRGGLLGDSAQTRFEARALTSALQDFVEIIVSWMHSQYEFDPAAVELGFGGKDDPAPAWEIALAGGHRLALQGRIDRVDLWRAPGGDKALAVVLDYKSGRKMLDKVLMEHGVQLQLLGYLAALRRWPNVREIFKIEELVSAGVFYVNLRGEYKAGGTRDEILAEAGESRRKAYRHSGRFDVGTLGQLDRIHAADQFNYRLKSNGELYAGSTEALPRAEFEALLDGVEAQLRAMGQSIFDGLAQVAPYRKGKQTPCEYCDYQAACRIDRWTHTFKVLR